MIRFHGHQYKEATSTDSVSSWEWVQDNARSGVPLVLDMYHGTHADLENFRFDPARIGSSTDEGWLGRGFYFTPHRDVALSYGRNTLAVRLTIRSPFIFPDDSNPIRFINNMFGKQEDKRIKSEKFTKWVKEQGHDGVVSTSLLHQVCVFDPSQIEILPNTSATVGVSVASTLKTQFGRSSTAVNTNTTGLQPDDRNTQTDSDPAVRTCGEGAGGTTKPPGSGVATHGPQHCSAAGTAGSTDRTVGGAVGTGTTATQRNRNPHQTGQTNMTLQDKVQQNYTSGQSATKLHIAQDPLLDEPGLDVPGLDELAPLDDDAALGDEGEPSEYEMTEELEKDPGANWRDLYLQPIIRAIRNRFDLEKGQVRLVSPKKKIPFGSDTLGFEVIGHVRFEDFTPSADEYGKSPYSFRATVDTNGELVLPVEVTGN
jgi:hypothetical protein